MLSLFISVGFHVASLDQLIRKNINPFDPTTFKPGNFWKEQQEASQNVESIHAHAIDSVEQTLSDVIRDHQTRTLMLLGDTGSGKSHLLGRIKQRLNNSACFAYVGPWPDNQFIWRHVLRQTVDSLMAVPEGHTDSQLLRWLKGLEIFKRTGVAQRILGERSVFIRDMRASFPAVYRGKDFFSALYALLNPDLQLVASDWLRGEDLDEEDLKLLRVKRSVDSEDAAQKMLSNVGWLADSTQPIVICFDNLDNIPDMPNGKSGLRAMFNVNSTIHNEKLKNFLVVISLITGNWLKNENDVEFADQARIDQKLTLRQINLEQAAGLWASRLSPIHAQADPPPTSPIAPLTKEWLAHEYPGERVAPRMALILAEQLILEFKRTGKLADIPVGDSSDRASGSSAASSAKSDRANFELMWQKEFKETGEHLRRISQFSSPELIRRLQEALEALEIPKVQHAILNSNAYCSYSLGHEYSGRVCIVWTEDSNLQSFFHVMRACKSMNDARTRDRIYLIREDKLGTARNRGYQIFQEVFSGKKNLHVKPDLKSIQYLETYHRLVNAAAGGELVIGAKTPNVMELQALLRESNVLATCNLLQHLDIIQNEDEPPESNGDEDTVLPPDPPGPSKKDIEAAERYILNIMTTQSLVGMQILVESTQEQVPKLDSAAVISLIHSLCDGNKIQMLDPNAKPKDQLLCYVPA